MMTTPWLRWALVKIWSGRSDSGLSHAKSPVKKVKKQHVGWEKRYRGKRGNKKLVEILAGMEEEEYRYRACLICQL